MSVQEFWGETHVVGYVYGRKLALECREIVATGGGRVAADVAE